jgi:ClpP class serine protease
MPNWDFVLKEIQKEKDEPGGVSGADKVRLKYLNKLYDHTKRNVICYYSGFLSKSKNIEGMEINDEDKNGFMVCVHKLDRSKGLDLFLHTPGGDGDATESLVVYLKKMFGNDIRAIVPQIAMSAGTIMACACKEILMGYHSNLGPVDPQINGIAAYRVLKEVETAFEQINKDERRSSVWNPILSNYTPGFLQHCQDAKDSAKKMVTSYLEENMFSDLPAQERILKSESVFSALADALADKGHAKHIHIDDLQKMGLKVVALEDPSDRILQDLVLTVHHCMIFTLSNTGATKIIENQMGHRWIKIIQMMQSVVQAPLIPQDILDYMRSEIEMEKKKGVT